MLTSKKSRLAALLAFILVAALLICAMSVSVFADTVEHDHDGDGVADHTAEEHNSSTTKKKTAWEKFWDKVGAWFDSDIGQIVGYCVAGVVLVAGVALIIWWIPKKDKSAKKEKKHLSK